MAERAPPLVIVGASYAGIQLAATARELGFEERIVVVGEESHAPYQRPPLSKGLLSGKTAPDQLQLRSPEFFDQSRIDLILARRVEAFDATTRRVSLDDGTELTYGWLALTTGARCRPFNLPGATLKGVFNVRTLDDALAVADAARAAKRACVIGGGFIGLEVASSLRARGVEVTIVESQSRLLTRSFPPAMSTYIGAMHESQGTRMLLGRGVRALRGEGTVREVELDDGTRIDCDMVVMGIGVVPNSELARDAGLAVGNGIEVDLLGRTSAPQVLAIGDVANVARSSTSAETVRFRLESIQAANDGAKAAASLLVATAPPSTVVPWFWSDQFHLKFQMAGLAAPSDEVVLRGNMATDRFSLFYLRAGALVAAHSVNRPAEHMLSRKLIGAQTRFTAAQLADESFDLKSALVAA
jgi:3-phenylpropionate/trans-cinnamate dioxygenase ferredoxin reductase subunit